MVAVPISTPSNVYTVHRGFVIRKVQTKTSLWLKAECFGVVIGTQVVGDRFEPARERIEAMVDGAIACNKYYSKITD